VRRRLPHAKKPRAARKGKVIFIDAVNEVTRERAQSFLKPEHQQRILQRKVAVADFDGVCSGDIYVFESEGSHGLLPELLPFICQTDGFFEHAIGTSAGSLSPRTNSAKFEFPLPPIDDWKDTVASHKEYEFAFVAATRHERRRPTPVGEVPESWEVVPLGDRYQVQLGKMMSDTARRGSDQVPYIRNANVQWNRLELDDVASMAMSPREREKFSLRPGDILACEGRHVGKSALWRDEIPGATYQKALHRARCADPPEPGDRRPARPRRRGALQAARHRAVGALGWPDPRQRGDDRLAARASARCPSARTTSMCRCG
jgi:hypothetical protein